MGSETRSREGQFNWHKVKNNLSFVVKHHCIDKTTWKTGWLNSTYSSALFLATTKSAALVTTVKMYEVCWCCVGGSYLTARVLMLPVVTISTEMNTRNCVVSVPHIAARTDSHCRHPSVSHKQITKIPQFYLLGKIRQLIIIVNKIDILLTLG